MRILGKDTIYLHLTILLLSFNVNACVSGVSYFAHLNEPSRAVWANDVANLLPPRDIPYETQEQNGISVSYNLFYVVEGPGSYYRLTLVFRNNTESRQILTPIVSLKDASGQVLNPFQYDAFILYATTMAQTQVPLPMDAGQALFVPQYANQRRNGQLMLQWASTFWLKYSYSLMPQTSQVGALLFPASALGALPMHVTVELGKSKFEFVTSSTPPINAASQILEGGETKSDY